MITTAQLREWQKKIKCTLDKSLACAKTYPAKSKMRQYYVHLAQTADAQLSLIERLIRQSKAQRSIDYEM